MLKMDFHNNKVPMTILTLITILNIGLILSFLTANIGGTGFDINGTGLYALAGLELALVAGAYLVSKRRNTAVHF